MECRSRGRLAGRQIVELALVSGAVPAESGVTEIVLDTQGVPSFGGQFRRLAAAVEQWRAEGFRLLLVAADAHQAEHLQTILREQQLEATMGSAPGGWADRAALAAAEGPPWPIVLVGDCSSGFAIPQLGLVVLTEQEIFGARRRSLARPKYQRGSPITAFTDLGPGDLVVHEDHGIGRYLGLRTMTVGDREATSCSSSTRTAISSTCPWSAWT